MKNLNEIFNGDTLEQLKNLPSACVDLVVSSPPYNIGKAYESKAPLESYLELQAEVLSHCMRVLKPSGSIFWQVGSFANKGRMIPLDVKFFPILEDLGAIPRNRIVWVRQHGLHAKNKFSCRHETILWFTKSDDYYFDLDAIRVPQKWQNKKHHKGDNKGKLSCNPQGKNPGDIWIFQNVKHNHEEQTIHPCQFPEAMIARIVLSTTKVGDTVLDPYMGVGTTAVVAKQLERNFLGAELDDKYFEVAERRLSGLPNDENVFPNLKSLRDYLEKTGHSSERYGFEVQKGKKATDRSKSKVFSEQYHLEQLEERLGYEETCFVADLEGVDRPSDPNLNGKSDKKNKGKKTERDTKTLF